MSLLKLSFDCGEPSLSVRRFSVHEAVSSLFNVSVWARSPSEDLDLEAIVGKPAVFQAVSGVAHLLASARQWTGVCSHMELVQAEPTGLSTYYLRIVPKLWFLTQRRNHRIFQRLSIPGIADELLQEWGIPPIWRIDRAAYPKLEYRVQYGESDYDFLNRLLEEAGISFFFHDGEKGSELILSDRPQDGEPRFGGPIAYVDNPNQAAEKEFVSNLRLSQQVRPGRYASRDHDFRRHPQFKLLAETPPLGSEEDRLEQYVYAPGSTAIIVKEQEAAAPSGNGQGQAHPGFLDRQRDHLIDMVDQRVTTYVDNEVTSALNKAVHRLAGGFAGGVAADVVGEIAGDVSGEIMGDVAGKLLSNVLGGHREALHLDLEKMLRNKFVEVVNKKIQGLVDDQGKKLTDKLDTKVTDAVTKGLGGGKLGGLVGGVAGDAVGDLAHGAMQEVANTVKGQVSKLGDNAAQGAAQPGAGAKQALAKLVGDDKGAVRHDERAGQQLALKGLQSLRAERRAITFETNVFDLRPGTTFSLLGHPRMDFDPTKKLLALEISFEGTHDAEWSCSASAVFATEPYRPPHKTPKPTIQGLQSAIVVGPKGQEIYTDEHGRVRVQFHWDRAAPFDDQSSLWMRVSYGWAGGGYGLIALPRVGHEVLVAFLEGDPDLPVVVGRVHGETTQVPHRLPESKTASAWRSASTPGGDGFNELLFEDAKGKELVYMQAERDMRRLVKRDETAITERNRLETIGVNAVKLVGRNETETIGMNRAVVIGSNLTETMGGDRVVNIGGGHTENVAKGLGITVGPQPPPPAPSGGGEPAPPPAPEIPAGVMKLDVKERLEITCGESKIVLDKSGKVEIIGTEFEFTASGHVGINGSIIDLN